MEPAENRVVPFGNVCTLFRKKEKKIEIRFIEDTAVSSCYFPILNTTVASTGKEREQDLRCFARAGTCFSIELTNCSSEHYLVQVALEDKVVTANAYADFLKYGHSQFPLVLPPGEKLVVPGFFNFASSHNGRPECRRFTLLNSTLKPKKVRAGQRSHYNYEEFVPLPKEQIASRRVSAVDEGRLDRVPGEVLEMLTPDMKSFEAELHFDYVLGTPLQKMRVDFFLMQPLKCFADVDQKEFVERWNATIPAAIRQPTLFPFFVQTGSNESTLDSLNVVPGPLFESNLERRFCRSTYPQMAALQEIESLPRISAASPSPASSGENKSKTKKKKDPLRRRTPYLKGSKLNVFVFWRPHRTSLRYNGQVSVCKSEDVDPADIFLKYNQLMVRLDFVERSLLPEEDVHVRWGSELVHDMFLPPTRKEWLAYYKRITSGRAPILPWYMLTKRMDRAAIQRPLSVPPYREEDPEKRLGKRLELMGLVGLEDPQASQGVAWRDSLYRALSMFLFGTPAWSDALKRAAILYYRDEGVRTGEWFFEGVEAAKYRSCDCHANIYGELERVANWLGVILLVVTGEADRKEGSIVIEPQQQLMGIAGKEDKCATIVLTHTQARGFGGTRLSGANQNKARLDVILDFVSSCPASVSSFSECACSPFRRYFSRSSEGERELLPIPEMDNRHEQHRKTSVTLPLVTIGGSGVQRLVVPCGVVTRDGFHALDGPTYRVKITNHPVSNVSQLAERRRKIFAELLREREAGKKKAVSSPSSSSCDAQADASSTPTKIAIESQQKAREQRLKEEEYSKARDSGFDYAQELFKLGFESPTCDLCHKKLCFGKGIYDPSYFLECHTCLYLACRNCLKATPSAAEKCPGCSQSARALHVKEYFGIEESQKKSRAKKNRSPSPPPSETDAITISPPIPASFPRPTPTPLISTPPSGEKREVRRKHLREQYAAASRAEKAEEKEEETDIVESGEFGICAKIHFESEFPLTYDSKANRKDPPLPMDEKRERERIKHEEKQLAKQQKAERKLKLGIQVIQQCL